MIIKSKVLFCQQSNSDFQKNNEEYENSILDTNQKYDVIIIDGIRRSECSRVIDASLSKFILKVY